MLIIWFAGITGTNEGHALKLILNNALTNRKQIVNKNFIIHLHDKRGML
jgi:hypothetical protein